MSGFMKSIRPVPVRSRTALTILEIRNGWLFIWDGEEGSVLQSSTALLKDTANLLGALGSPPPYDSPYNLLPRMSCREMEIAQMDGGFLIWTHQKVKHVGSETETDPMAKHCEFEEKVYVATLISSVLAKVSEFFGVKGE